MGRKKYFRPSVESETVFEQTSLACNATEPWPDAVTGSGGEYRIIDGAAFVSWCERDVSKGGNFWEGCSEVPYYTACVVALS